MALSSQPCSLVALLLMLYSLSSMMEISDGASNQMHNSSFPTNIHDAAKIAIAEIKKLSDDNSYYETLELKEILHAETSVGTFHKNIDITLSLSASNFASGKDTEKFQVLVMTAFDEERVTGIAIKELPAMKKKWTEESETAYDDRYLK
eukprot:3882167-Ditylum_brightwellii.AAC.1